MNISMDMDQRILHLAFELFKLKTECVSVPSSNHVAEIVGKRGSKIKGLQAKTNTLIIPPKRYEEPVFVISGRKEDVAYAKRELLNASEYFTKIRGNEPACCTSDLQNSQEYINIQIHVPYHLAGLIIGHNGYTIKRIQSQTDTCIVSPTKDMESVFIVTGLPDKVEAAKREIEDYIVMHTGTRYTF